jgi:drug/metabolite transporter (DMT)-like permease
VTVTHHTAPALLQAFQLGFWNVPVCDRLCGGGTLPMLFFLKIPSSLEISLTIAYLGIFPAACAYIAWTYALANFSTARASSFLYLVPVVAIIVGWLWLDEKPALLSIVGGATIMAGVVLVNDAKLKPKS